MATTLLQNKVVGTVVAAFIKRRKRELNQPAQIYRQYPPTYWIADAIPMHVISQEVYEMQAEVTQHAVESNVVFSDHVIIKPLLVHLTFAVTNIDGLGRNAQQSQTSLDCAIEVFKSRQLFELQTTHKLLDNMVCTSITPENNVGAWGALQFNATFQQVTLAVLQQQKLSADKVLGYVDASGVAGPPPSGPSTPASAAAPKQMGMTQPVSFPDKKDLTSYLNKSTLDVRNNLGVF